MVPDLLIHALVVFGAASAAPVERTGRDLIPMIATELALEQREAMWIEEHELRWPGDVENVTSRNAPDVVRSLPREGTITYERHAGDDVLAVLERAVAAYNAADLPFDYAVRRDAAGVHVMAERVRDAEGAWYCPSLLLDTRVSLDGGRKPLDAAFGELVEALQAASGKSVRPGGGLPVNLAKRVQVELSGEEQSARDYLSDFEAALDSAVEEAGAFYVKLVWRPWKEAYYLTIDYRIAPPPPLPENAELFR